MKTWTLLLLSIILLAGCSSRETVEPSDDPSAGYIYSEANDFTYVINKDFYPVPALSQPAKGTVFQDPDFNTDLVRVTDAAADFGGTSAVVRYCKSSPLSVDSKYLLLQGGGIPSSVWDSADRTVAGNKETVIYDWETMTFLECPPHIRYNDPYHSENGNGPPEYRWDSRILALDGEEHPNRLYYRYGTKLYYCEVQAGWEANESVLVHDFAVDYPGLRFISNGSEGEPSRDMRYWAFMGFGPYDGQNYPQIVLFTYDMYTDTIVGQIGDGTAELPEWVNFIDVSPDGSKVVCSWYWIGDGSEHDGPHTYDMDFTNSVKVGGGSKHSNWAYGYNGSVHFVQDWSDWLTATDPFTGATTDIIYHQTTGWRCNHHLPRFYNPLAKGWTSWATYHERDGNDIWSDNQIMIIEIKPDAQTPRFWRVAHNYNDFHDYWSEAWSALSYDSQILFWNSNWMNTGNNETYAALLPNQWWYDMNPTAVESERR